MEELIEKYKLLFRQWLLSGRIPEHQEILKHIVLGLTEEISSEVWQKFHQTAHEWNNNIWNLNYFNQFLSTSFEELVFYHHLKMGIFGHGKFTLHDLILDQNDYNIFLETLAIRAKQSWNYSSPFCSFQFDIHQQSYRFSLVHPSLSPKNEAQIFIRKQHVTGHKLEKFVSNDEETKILKYLIASKANFVVSGSTGSGKSSLLQALLNENEVQENTIILEDTPEITLQKPGVINLLAQDNFANKSLKDLCAYVLRMRPERLVVGELRSKEIVPFILLMNTGHKGLMSTLHANDAKEALHRLVTLFLLYNDKMDMPYELALKLITTNIDYVIHLENKKIKEIIRVIGSDGATALFDKVISKEGRDEESLLAHGPFLWAQ
jgi:Flp pilus assembly CpaF family ATPase